jgi:hypothetical protein
MPKLGLALAQLEKVTHNLDTRESDRFEHELQRAVE